MMGTRRTRARNREIAPGLPFGAKFFARAVRQHRLISHPRRPLFGLGNPAFGNTICCLITTLVSFGGATPADCIANNQRLSESTIGFWQTVYEGDYGRVTFGAQHEYLKPKAFNGIGGAPSTDDNVVMTAPS